MPYALTMLIPEAVGSDPVMDEQKRAFYEHPLRAHGAMGWASRGAGPTRGKRPEVPTIMSGSFTWLLEPVESSFGPSPTILNVQSSNFAQTPPMRKRASAFDLSSYLRYS